MKNWMLLLAFLAALAPGAQAAPLERDLGQGLAYFRVHSIPLDLPSDESMRHRPCVLDVRYVRGDRAAASALFAWLQSHAGPKSPVFLLANPETSPVLLVPLNPANSVPGLVVLGPAARNFEPDISVSVTPQVERQAYDSLEKGGSIDSLLSAPVEKERYDEERLDRDHVDDSAPEPAAQPAQPPPPPHLIDPVLQRAVQLDRSLLALKRL